jgi:phytoene dehydrogenase-like protein
MTIENPRLPGFRHNSHSFFHRAVTAMPWYRDLELEHHGVRYLEPKLNVAMILRDGRALEWWTDLDRTVEPDQSPSEAGAAQADRNEIDLFTGRGSHSAEGPSTKSSPLEDIEPLTIPPRHAAPPPSVARRPPDVAAPAAEDEARDVADEDESWTEPFAKPDMRGMSKKQRRKLMAELREKERAARRP